MNAKPLYRVSYGQTRYVSFESVSRNRVHRHAYFEPCVVISGSGEFEHGAEVFPLNRGDLFVADRGVYHEIRSIESRDLRLYFLSFHVVQSHDEKLRRRQSPLSEQNVADFLLDHRTHLPGQSHLIPLFEHITKLVRRDSDYRHNRNYHDATLLLLRQIITALTTSALLSEEAYSDHMRRNRVEQLIEDRLHLPLRVTDIANACGMSDRTLRRKWRSWTARPLREEINQRRMERACHLLLLPDIAIADVGYQVGVASSAQFSRLFKQAKGVTPGAYRKQFLDASPQGLSGANPHLTEYRDSESDG